MKHDRAVRQHSFSIGVLTLPDEVADTIRLVDSLLTLIGPDDMVYVHVNGPRSDAFETLDHPRVHVSDSVANLGVAGGRNHLLDQPGFLDRSLAVSLDNDLIVDDQLLNRFDAAVEDLGGCSLVGEIGVPTYDFDRAKRHVPQAFRPACGPLGSAAEVVDAAAFRSANLSAAEPLLPQHAGIAEDWKYAYFSPRASLAAADGAHRRELKPRNARDDAGFLAQLRSTRYLPASNLGGGTICTPTSALRLLRYNDAFNPYGTEDADYAIRLLKAGRRNYALLEGILPHGHHDRHVLRRSDGGHFLTAVNRARTSFLLAHQHADTAAKTTTLQLEVARQLLAATARGSRRPIDYREFLGALIGIEVAEEQVQTGAPARWNRDVALELTDSGISRFGDLRRRPVSLGLFETAADEFSRRRATAPTGELETWFEGNVGGLTQSILHEFAVVKSVLLAEQLAKPDPALVRRALSDLERPLVKAALRASNLVTRSRRRLRSRGAAR